MLRQGLKGVGISAITLLGLAACSGGAGMGGLFGGNGSFKNTNACKTNTFLQKYDCSTNKIESAAETGEPDAQYALGYLYYYGIGTKKDLDVARLWIRKAAAQGQPLAIKALQMMDGQSFAGSGQTTAPGAQSYPTQTPSYEQQPMQQQQMARQPQSYNAAPANPAIQQQLPLYGSAPSTPSAVAPPPVSMNEGAADYAQADWQNNGTAPTQQVAQQGAQPQNVAQNAGYYADETSVPQTSEPAYAAQAPAQAPTNMPMTPVAYTQTHAVPVHDPRLDPGATPVVAGGLAYEGANTAKKITRPFMQQRVERTQPLTVGYNATGYTVQLGVVSRLETVKSLATQAHLDHAIHYYPVNSIDGQRYLLTYGHYATAAEATAAMKALPVAFRAMVPTIQPWTTVAELGKPVSTVAGMPVVG